jgi:CRISPR-associated protein Csd1
MILRKIYESAPTILGEESIPALYVKKPVRWIIRLNLQGEPEGADWIEEQAGDKDKRGIERVVPSLVRTSGIRAILLADKAEYVLGLPATENRVHEMHESFKQLVHRCAEKTRDPLVLAVDHFLARWQPDMAKLPPTFRKALEEQVAKSGNSASEIITFSVGGQFPIERSSVQQFWAEEAKPQEEGADNQFQSLVTGKWGFVDKSLPGAMLKGIPGGQPTGIALVSANSKAFESYGLERAQNTPLLREEGEQIVKAINALIANPKSRFFIANLVYLFWSDRGMEEDFIGCLEGDPESVKSLFESPYQGKEMAESVSTRFYALALAASRGRAVVKDWIMTTLPNIEQRLRDWFLALKIVGADGNYLVNYPKLYHLAACLYRDPRKEMVDAVPIALIHTALRGDSIPSSIRDQVVLRCRAQRNVTHLRAALIKAWLYYQNPTSGKENSGNMEANVQEEKLKKLEQLDQTNHDPAYLCGRLLAQLDAIQRRAFAGKKLNTTIVDRFYGAASSAPASVFGMLIGHANKAHLPQIRKQDPKAYNALQNSLADILRPLQSFPRVLNLEKQALFALGFYHQRADNIKNALLRSQDVEPENAETNEGEENDDNE